MTSSRKLNVLLLVGGDSSERDVSLSSGKSVFTAAREAGHRVLVADPLRPDLEPSEDPIAVFGGAEIGNEPTRLTQDRYDSRQRFLHTLSDFSRLGCDIVFNGLHGGAGEDGTLQAVLDYLGIPYTGSGALASAVGMNKELSKRLVSQVSVPVAKQVFVEPERGKPIDVGSDILEMLSLPVVVKPNHEGSSVGVAVVHTPERLAAAVESASAFGGPYLVEEYIAGAEITAAVLHDVELPLLEIRPKDGFYDFHNKYTSGACEYLVPAPMDRATSDAIAKSAAAAYRAMGFRGYARIDFRVTGAGQHFFLEGNTLPGLTANSLVPKAAAGVGISFSELVDRILFLGARHNELLY